MLCSTLGIDPKRDRVNLRIVGDEAVRHRRYRPMSSMRLFELHLWFASQETRFEHLSDLAKLKFPSRHGSHGAAQLSQPIAGNWGKGVARAHSSDRVYREAENKNA